MANFLKWVGGKSQLLAHIEPHLIKHTINTYREPFLGGGSVLIHLLNMLESDKINVNGIRASDYNTGLINTYNQIKKNTKCVIKHLKKICNEYQSGNTPQKQSGRKNLKLVKPLEGATKEEVYYYYRDKFNKLKEANSSKKSLMAALFIFLNKTGFRGLYRESKTGVFNVPYGNYKNPKIYDEKNLMQLSYLFNKYQVKFKVCDFRDVKVKNHDFVYLDPPYYPETATSFVSYNKSGFADAENQALVDLCKRIHRRKAHFLLSNSNADYIHKKYKKYNINTVSARRAINSKKPESTTTEVLVSNV